MFPDEVLLLLDGARIAGDSKLDDDMGAVSKLPMRSERCGRLAARTMFEPRTDSMRWKNMACNWDKVVLLVRQGVQTFVQGNKASSVTSRKGLNFVVAPMDTKCPTSVMTFWILRHARYILGYARLPQESLLPSSFTHYPLPPNTHSHSHKVSWEQRLEDQLTGSCPKIRKEKETKS